MGQLGLDYVNISGDDADLRQQEGLEVEERQVGRLWYERLARSLLRREGMDLAVMGSGYSALGRDALVVAARRLRSGYTDLIGFGRQSFADPLLPARVRAGQPVNYCVCCSSCGRLMNSGWHAGCVVHDPYYREQLRELQRSQRPDP
jgi:2,4-dienoyl-CoA reductase-like NADH-dependent reductase (Old Yellow Enzyme family)